MTTKKRLLAGAVAAVAFAVPVAIVSANHVRIEAPVVSSPPASVVVPVPAPTQTVQANEIKGRGRAREHHLRQQDRGRRGARGRASDARREGAGQSGEDQGPRG